MVDIMSPCLYIFSRVIVMNNSGLQGLTSLVVLDPGFKVINCVHSIAIISYLEKIVYVGSGFTRGILVSGVHVKPG